MRLAAEVESSVDGPRPDPVLDELVADVVAQVRRLNGNPADAGEVRGLIEREWAGYADARLRAVIRQVLGRA